MTDKKTPEAPVAPVIEMTVETGPHVYRAVADVMKVMSQEGISKSRRSGDGGGPKFQFRGIDDVYNALSSVMADNRLMMLPRMIGRETTERTTRAGGAMFYTVVEAEFDLVSAVDGSKHTIRTFGEAMDSSDKSTNKAMSAAFKYAAMQAFCIPTEGDNDADATTHEVAPRAQQRQTAQREQPKDDAPSLAQRALKFEGALRAAKLDDLPKAWAKGSQLCAELSTEEPGILASLTKLYEKLSDPVPF